MPSQHFLTEAELDALLRETPVFDLEAVKHRTLSRVEKGTIQPMKKKSLLRGLLIAAVICALSISSLAVANYVMDGRIAATLGIGTAQAETLNSSGQNLNLTCEDQGTTMTVLQTLGDQNALYVLVRFDFPEMVELTDDMTFHDIFADFGASGGWTYDIVDRTAHSRTYLLEIETAKNLTGQSINLTFQNFGYYVPTEDENGNPISDNVETSCQAASTEDDGFCSVVSGTWKQSWTLDYEDTSTTWNFDQPFTLGGQAMTLSRVRVSQLSATVTLNTEETENDYNIMEDGILVFRYADGTELTPDIRSAGTGWEDGKYTVQVLFDEVLDTDGLSAIVLDGTVIPLT